MLVLTVPAFSQENVEWTTSRSGGSEIDIPVFMTEGWMRGLMDMGVDMGTAFEPEVYPVQLRQYRTKSDDRPIVHLNALLGDDADEVTYRLDRTVIAAISGYGPERREIFYGICRLEEVVVCVDVHYPPELQSFMGPIVDRIAKSFRNDS